MIGQVTFPLVAFARCISGGLHATLSRPVRHARGTAHRVDATVGAYAADEPTLSETFVLTKDGQLDVVRELLVRIVGIVCLVG